MKFLNIENRLQLMDEDVVVGFVEFTHEECSLVLEDIYVYPGYRENGYAKKLCDEFIDLSRTKQKTIETNCWYFIELYS